MGVNQQSLNPFHFLVEVVVQVEANHPLIAEQVENIVIDVFQRTGSQNEIPCSD
jgi:hypothetical protein